MRKTAEDDTKFERFAKKILKQGYNEERSGPSSGGFKFDTTLPGNSNQGHDVGKSLNDEERWALIEYLKTL